MPKVTFEIVKGSILDAKTDALVNPANSHLNHAGGLARVIARQAAPLAHYRSMDDAYYAGEPGIERWAADQVWAAEQGAHPLVATGDAGWTSPGRLGDLGFRGIVHAVGPVWGGGAFCEAELLSAAHMSAMRVAYAKHCTSVAFPAISCGVFGYPVAEAAPVAFAALRFAQSLYPMDVKVVLLEQDHYDAYQEAAGESA